MTTVTVVTTLMRMDMGRRVDDFTADIVDMAVQLQRNAGSRAAQRFLDLNQIEPDMAKRVLYGPRQLLRASDLAPRPNAAPSGDARINN